MDWRRLANNLAMIYPVRYQSQWRTHDHGEAAAALVLHRPPGLNPERRRLSALTTTCAAAPAIVLRHASPLCSRSSPRLCPSSIAPAAARAAAETILFCRCCVSAELSLFSDQRMGPTIMAIAFDLAGTPYSSRCSRAFQRPTDWRSSQPITPTLELC